MNQNLNKDKIIIIDFGSQVTKLIARRIRECSVFSEILTPNDLKKIYLKMSKVLFCLEAPRQSLKIYFQKYQIKSLI